MRSNTCPMHAARRLEHQTLADMRERDRLNLLAVVQLVLNGCLPLRRRPRSRRLCGSVGRRARPTPRSALAHLPHHQSAGCTGSSLCLDRRTSGGVPFLVAKRSSGSAIDVHGDPVALISSAFVNS
jgi:hypothetical protein